MFLGAADTSCKAVYLVQCKVCCQVIKTAYWHINDTLWSFFKRRLISGLSVRWRCYLNSREKRNLGKARSLYRTVVTICTAQWSLYVPYSGHYMCRTVVSICTTSLTFSNSTFRPHSVFMCFVWIWEQTVVISLYSINWLVCITETECVYCAVRTGSLNVSQFVRCL